jgi:hypothetical protein
MGWREPQVASRSKRPAYSCRAQQSKQGFILWHSCPAFEFVVQPRTESEQMRTNKRLIKRQNERKRKLEQAGIKYDFEAVSYVRFFWFSLPFQKLIMFP